MVTAMVASWYVLATAMATVASWYILATAMAKGDGSVHLRHDHVRIFSRSTRREPNARLAGHARARRLTRLGCAGRPASACDVMSLRRGQVGVVSALPACVSLDIRGREQSMCCYR